MPAADDVRFRPTLAKVTVLIALIRGLFRVALLNFLYKPFWWATGRYPPYTRRGACSVPFLTKVLRKTGKISPDARVLSVSVKPIAPGAMAQVHRLTVTVQDKTDVEGTGEQPPLTFVLKEYGNRAKDQIIDALLGLVDVERNGTALIHSLGIPDIMPRLYSFEANLTLAMSVSICEDLGYLRSAASKKPCPIPDLKLIMAAVGTLHGRTWNDEDAARRVQRPALVLDHTMQEDVTAVQKNSYSGPLLQKLPHLRRTLEALSRPRAFDDVQRRVRGFGLCDFYNREPAEFERARSMIQPVQRRRPHPFVIHHGDARQDNAFFFDGTAERPPRAVLIDWQAVIPIHPGKDIVWTLMDVSSADLEQPGALEDVINAYLQGVRGGRHATAVVGADSDVGRITAQEVIASWIPLGVFGCALIWTTILRHIVRGDFDPNGDIARLFVNYMTRLDRLAEVHCQQELERLERM